MSFLAVVLAAVGAWTGVLAVLLLLVFYLLTIRLTGCRVQTKQGTPCRWLVRGVLGTCDWHRGLKRGLPRLVRVRRSVLPALLWLRPEVEAGAATVDPQPPVGAAAAQATTDAAARPMYDWWMLAFTALAAVVAVLSYAHQILAG